MTDRLADWLNNRLTDWVTYNVLAELLTDGWLTYMHLLINQLTDQLTDWLTGLLADWPVGRSSRTCYSVQASQPVNQSVSLGQQSVGQSSSTCYSVQASQPAHFGKVVKYSLTCLYAVTCIWRSTNWLMGWLTDWLADLRTWTCWMAKWLTHADWLIDSLTCLCVLANWLIDWLAELHTCLKAYWPIEWLTDWLCDR